MAQASAAATEKPARKANTRKAANGGKGFCAVLLLDSSWIYTANAATITLAKEILVQAPHSIWESQAKLLRLEVDSTRNAFEFPYAGPAFTLSPRMHACA